VVEVGKQVEINDNVNVFFLFRATVVDVVDVVDAFRAF
jgi:hypothetical protein